MRSGSARLSERGGLDAELGQELAGGFVVLGMDPGGVERLFAFVDLEEAGGLNEGGLAEAADVHQLLATFEGSVLLAMFVDAAGGELVHARDVAQERTLALLTSTPTKLTHSCTTPSSVSFRCFGRVSCW